MKTKVYVEGMSCGHCVKHVNEALSEIENIKNVEVSQETQTAICESSEEISSDKIKFAIQEAGYEVIKIEKL